MNARWSLTIIYYLLCPSCSVLNTASFINMISDVSIGRFCPLTHEVILLPSTKSLSTILNKTLFEITFLPLPQQILCSSSFSTRQHNTTACAAVPWPLSKTCLSFSGRIHELCYLSPNFQHDLWQHRLTRTIALTSAGRPCLSGSADTMWDLY